MRKKIHTHTYIYIVMVHHQVHGVEGMFIKYITLHKNYALGSSTYIYIYIYILPMSTL